MRLCLVYLVEHYVQVLDSTINDGSLQVYVEQERHRLTKKANNLKASSVPC